MTIEQEQEIKLMAFFYNGCANVLDEAQRRIMIGQTLTYFSFTP